MDISVYNYVDYVRFLNDWLDAKRKENPNYSKKLFSQKIGLKSSSTITMILNNSRNISRKQIFSFAKAMEFNFKETKYFEAIILYQDSKEYEEKKYHWDVAQGLRPLTKSSILEKNKFEFFNNWYIPALRELVTYFDFNGDFELLGKQFVPAISKKDVEKAFNLLLDLDLIRPREVTETSGSLTFKKSQTLYELTDNVIVTPDDIMALAMHNFQKQTLAVASNALDAFKLSERNIQSTTIGTSKQGVFELNRLIDDFQARVLKIANDNPEVDCVYNLNIQLHPVTVKEAK